jgi:hypothetical protein
MKKICYTAWHGGPREIEIGDELFVYLPPDGVPVRRKFTLEEMREDGWWYPLRPFQEVVKIPTGSYCFHRLDPGRALVTPATLPFVSPVSVQENHLVPISELITEYARRCYFAGQDVIRTVEGSDAPRFPLGRLNAEGLFPEVREDQLFYCEWS